MTERQLAAWPNCPPQQGSNDVIDSVTFHHPQFLQDLQAAPLQSFLSNKYLLVVHLWEGPRELPGPLDFTEFSGNCKLFYFSFRRNSFRTQRYFHIYLSTCIGFYLLDYNLRLLGFTCSKTAEDF